MDPAKGLDGSLMPIAGYKGCGISVALDLLCSLVTQGMFSWQLGYIGNPEEKMGSSHFMMAIDIFRLVGREEYDRHMSKYAEEFKKATLKESVKAVYLPGEIEWGIEQDRRKNGIPYPDNVLVRLNALADSVGACRL